jgi:hypothetical protein
VAISSWDTSDVVTFVLMLVVVFVIACLVARSDE